MNPAPCVRVRASRLATRELHLNPRGWLLACSSRRINWAQKLIFATPCTARLLRTFLLPRGPSYCSAGLRKHQSVKPKQSQSWQVTKRCVLDVTNELCKEGSSAGRGGDYF